ncbi:MAG: hypothetical protein ABRQ26_10385 [Syntrophomonadaceae bacterium]
MSTFSILNEKNPMISKIGFWSSLLTGILNIWYFLAFAMYQPILHAPWSGMESYAESFKQLPFLTWVIPCFFLTVAFLTMIISVHAVVEEENKIWSLAALVFAAIYAAILSTNYYIQMAVVRHNLIHNMTEGLSLWLYANYYPYSIPGALEGVGYFFMCLSFLCASRVFGQGKLERWIRWLFAATGILGLVVFTDPLFKLPLIMTLIDLGLVGLLLTIGPVLLAVLFKKSNVQA